MSIKAAFNNRYAIYGIACWVTVFCLTNLPTNKINIVAKNVCRQRYKPPTIKNQDYYLMLRETQMLINL